MADVYYRNDGNTVYYRNGQASGYKIRPNWDPLNVETQISSGKTIIIELVNDKFILPYNSSYLFGGAANSTFNDMDKGDTSGARNMSSMFFSCSGVTEFDFSNFDTSNVTNMSAMFAMQPSEGSKFTQLDLSTFDTSNVTDMSSMFKNFSGTQLSLLNFDMSKVKNVNYMFNGCKNLTEILVEKNIDGSINTINRTGDGMFIRCSNLPNGDGTTDLSRANNTTPTGYFGIGHPGTKYQVYIRRV